MDPDQAGQNVGSDLDHNCLTLLSYFGFFFWKKLMLKSISAKSADNKNFRSKMTRGLPSMQRVEEL